MSEFAKQLKAWRGARLQKEVAPILGINLRTYEGYEYGKPASAFVRRTVEKIISSGLLPKDQGETISLADIQNDFRPAPGAIDLRGG